MEIKRIEGEIEAILFAMGEAVELPRIARAIRQDPTTTENIKRNMMISYQEEERGFQIIEIENSFQLCTKKEYYDSLIRIAAQPKNPKLKDVMIDTLSIIAYKQPITKGQIEHIRGVNSDGCVNRLYERGLIEEKGRLDAPGRPILYVTTDSFLRCFGLTKPTDLPPLDLRSLNLETSQGLQLEIDENGENIVAENEENTEQ